MPKAIKKKVKQKNTAAETEVQDRISDIRELMRQKQKAVVMYGSAAAAVIVVAGGLFFYKYISNEKSRQAEYEAYKTYYNEFQKTPLTGREQFKKASELYSQAYAKNKSPKLLLYIAGSHTEAGNYPEAIKSLEHFLKNHPSERRLLPLAYKQLANVQLKAGNKAEALKALDELYKMQGDIYKDVALYETARILESDGKKEEAQAKYKELAEKFKDSPFFNEAKAKLGEKKEG